MSEAPRPRVLLIDDDEVFRKAMSGELSRRGYPVATAETGQIGVERAAGGDIDVVLLDLRMPDLDGIEVLRRLHAREVPAPVIVLSGHGTIDNAIQAVKLGAHDFLEKPCPLDHLEMVIQKAYEHLRLSERRRVLEDGYVPPDVRQDVVGATPAFRKVLDTLSRVAATDFTVLILGETGVGKERMAALLHAESARRDGPFVVMDCASLHEDLLQSELFGHEKGAFTGAVRQRHGLFEVAHGGTLFLDEVGETSPDVQAKLLRVLETGRFRRLGGTREVAVDVRLVSATNRDLKEAVARGHFREDLYFRLATVMIEIPALRNRRGDVPLLVDHFIRRLNARLSRPVRFSPEALELFQRYRWPGNVRELIHAIEQAVVLCSDAVVRPEDLPAALRQDAQAPGVEPLTLREVERRHVLSVVAGAGGNRTQAARILGISQRNLYRLLRRWGVMPEGSDNPS